MSAEYWARQRLLLLNKASGGIGRTLDVIGTAQELATTPVPGFVDLVSVDLFDEVLRGEEPPSVAAFTPGETHRAQPCRPAQREGGASTGLPSRRTRSARFPIPSPPAA